MKEVLSAIAKYKFGAKFRLTILFSSIFLVLFHISVLIAPFVFTKSSLSEERITHLRTISNSISNITLALILMVVIAEGQGSLRAMIAQQRRQTYLQTEQQILEWFNIVEPLTFDSSRNVVNSEPSAYQGVLRNFKVEGSPCRIMELYGYYDGLRGLVEEYCKNVHFEITCYPSEIIYGIHIELEDYSLSEDISKVVIEKLNLNKQSKGFVNDTDIPKRPGWVFITKTVSLTGEEGKDFSNVLTHARHFVELVCHNYDFLYSKDAIDEYIARTG